MAIFRIAKQRQPLKPMDGHKSIKCDPAFNEEKHSLRSATAERTNNIFFPFDEGLAGWIIMASICLLVSY